jgi:N utilization substance protein B
VIGSRTRSREIALQTLYTWDVDPNETSQARDQTLELAEASDEVREFAKTLVEGVLADLTAIDFAISCAAENWSLSRLAVIDRNVLRLAVFEFTHLDEIPPAVSMDEAIELGKRFSTKQSGSFINGVLDRIRRDLGIEIDEATMRSLNAAAGVGDDADDDESSRDDTPRAGVQDAAPGASEKDDSADQDATGAQERD